MATRGRSRRDPAITSDASRATAGAATRRNPPTIEDIIALLRACPDTPSGRRTKTLIIVLWRSGLRISEALALEERDLDVAAGSITVRCGKGGKRRIVGMDRWAWAQITGWLSERLDYPRGRCSA